VLLSVRLGGLISYISVSFLLIKINDRAMQVQF